MTCAQKHIDRATGGPPFPNHAPQCPFQALPLGTECTCGASEREWARKFGKPCPTGE